MSKIVSRLKEYIDLKGLSVAAFEKSIGMSNASFGRSLKNNGAIGTDKLENILSAYCDINPIWLLTGEGEMLCKENTHPNTHPNTYLVEKESNPSSEKNAYPIHEKGNSDLIAAEPKYEYGKKAENNLYPQLNIPDVVSIPIVEISVAAGGGCYNNDNLEVIDNIQLPQSMVKRGAQYFCVRIKGESMAPTLLDSSFLVIRLLDRGEWEYMPEEQVYVVTDREGKAYVKRVKNRLDKGFVVCMSDNPDKAYYPNFNLQENEINTIWHAEWYISAKMPNIHQTYYTKVSQLEDDMSEMKNDLANLRKLITSGV